MKRHTKEEFVQLARNVHGDKYDYSQVEYVNVHTKVRILCLKCNRIYEMRPVDHLHNHGCPKCGLENLKTLIFGVGKNDLFYTKNTPLYKTWFSMLARCYNKQLQITKHKSYIDCSVCDEWLYLSNFKKWFDENYVEGYQLDKDIIVKGNKIYSPETCCFVPGEINSIFTKTNALRGKYPIGVTKTHYHKYAAKHHGERKYLGVFNTPEEAFYAYKQAKEKYIQEVAQKYFNEGKITERVYNALMKYEVEITD